MSENRGSRRLGTSPRDLAAWTADAAGLGSPSVDLVRTLNFLGLGYSELETCPRSSRLALADGRLEVQVRKAPRMLQRFWTAHEIGHFLLATRLDVPFREQVRDPAFETYCNNYASHLLLPSRWLRDQVQQSPQSMIVALKISDSAETSIASTVLALNQRAGWDSTLVTWAVDRRGRWRASSVIGHSGCGMIAATEDTDAYLDRIQSSIRAESLPIEIGGTAKRVRAESIRWRNRCFSLFQRASLAS